MHIVISLSSLSLTQEMTLILLLILICGDIFFFILHLILFKQQYSSIRFVILKKKLKKTCTEIGLNN